MVGLELLSHLQWTLQWWLRAEIVVGCSDQIYAHNTLERLPLSTVTKTTTRKDTVSVQLESRRRESMTFIQVSRSLDDDRSFSQQRHQPLSLCDPPVAVIVVHDTHTTQDVTLPSVTSRSECHMCTSC